MAGPAPQPVWADANIILRLLTGRPIEQADKAEALMHRAERGEVRLWVCSIVVAEVVWVLTSAYGFSTTDSAEAVLGFLNCDGLIVDEGPVVLASLQTMTETSVDFADAYLAVRAGLSGLPVASFDRDFDRLGVERVPLGT